LQQDDTHKKACTIAKILDEKLAKDITILNIKNVSVIADYFVICSAETTTQTKALSGYVREKIKELYEILPSGDETDTKNRWHLLDYGDIIVHIMHKEERQYYALEKFWSHACKVNQDEWEKISVN